MTSGRRRGTLERNAASDLWRRTLSQIPSVFGRLVYLSSLRNVNTGTYEHHGLALVFGEEDADRALRRSHEGAFSEWLNYSLEQQKADLDLYLSAISGERAPVLETWTRLMPFRNLVPISCSAADRLLYFTDFELLLELLRAEHGVVCSGPDA